MYRAAEMTFYMLLHQFWGDLGIVAFIGEILSQAKKKHNRFHFVIFQDGIGPYIPSLPYSKTRLDWLFSC